MAATTLPAVGSQLGPCQTACNHTDCAETRRMAAESCAVCGKTIGYETRFYETPNRPHRPTLSHAACRESKIEGTIIVWQVWSFLFNGYVFSSYEESACVDFARNCNAILRVPAFEVERSHILAGRTI